MCSSVFLSDEVGESYALSVRSLTLFACEGAPNASNLQKRTQSRPREENLERSTLCLLLHWVSTAQNLAMFLLLGQYGED